MVSVQVRKQQVAYAVGRGISQRRACTLIDVSRAMLAYEPRMPAKDSRPAARMKELSSQYPRYGYRRIQIFLARDGFAMSAARAWRLWASQGLQLPRRRSRKRVATGRPRPLAPTRANQVWSYDFVFDSCADGKQLKCLTLIDEFTKEALAIDVAGSIRSARVIDVLSRVVSQRGAPTYLRSDNGPEFVAHALLKWATDNKIETALIDPGKPWQNGTTESFNGKFRDECLSLEWFRNRLEARVVIKEWMAHYNEVRPHSSLGYKTPREFVEQLTPKGNSGEAKVNMVLA